MQKEFKKFEDTASRTIGRFAGSLSFVYFNVFFFIFWVLMNTGVFGENLMFDPFPFEFLTFVVSLEAIFLATFVLIVQNREARISDRRARLDYSTNVKAEAENRIIMTALERIAKKSGVELTDLRSEMNKLEDSHVHLHDDI